MGGFLLLAFVRLVALFQQTHIALSWCRGLRIWAVTNKRVIVKSA